MCFLHFMFSIPVCIDLQGQFWGGREEGGEGSFGDWSQCGVERALFGNHNWGDLCKLELGDAATHFEDFFQRPTTVCPSKFVFLITQYAV